MNISRKFKKIFWFIDAFIASKKYPLNESLTYLGVTGTDGKTTTCSFLYEIARSHGYRPLLITTVGAKFDGEDIPLDIKSTSFLAYSIKTFFYNLIKLNFPLAFKAIFLLDVEGFNKQSEQHRTTPLASETRKTILEYEKKGANLFIIETTSHALDQFRVYGIKYDSVAITNITNEHLDYHGTWESYASTKSKIFNMLKEGGTAPINRDDPMSFEFVKNKLNELRNSKSIELIEYYATDFEKINQNNFYISIKNLKNTDHNLELRATAFEAENSFKTKVNIIGKYNIYNAIAAFSCFYGFNSSNPQGIAEGISRLQGVKGRMQLVSNEPKIIVDYAHTPNAMLSVLKSTQKNNGKIWVIFGCTGERDRYKRPVMGKIAFDYADNILLTADDTRLEKLININNEIVLGFKDLEEDFTIYSYYNGIEYLNSEKKFVLRFDEQNISSRRNAIKFAIDNASKSDTIYILGIGHQNTVLIDTIEYKWNDIDYVKSQIGIRVEN